MEVQQSITYKSILVSTFSELVDYLESHDLNWFVGFGTLIGTIRHRGLIPWDDDIDILMPRDDYNKLLELYRLESSTHYYIKSINDRDYPFAFAKFCHKNSTIVETKTIPCAFGIYVDIFPIDTLGVNYNELLKLKAKYETLHRNYEKSLNRYSFRYLCSLVSGLRALNICAYIKDTFWHRPFSSYYRKVMKQIEAIKTTDNNIYSVILTGVYGERDIYMSEWFAGFKYMKFENIYVRVPIGYDECLKKIYGDYMNLPPKEEQVPKHKHVYENIVIGMSLNEAKNYYNDVICPNNE